MNTKICFFKMASILIISVALPSWAKPIDMSLPPATVSSLPTDSVYDRAYSLDENKIDKRLLGRNTGLLVGAGIGTMGLLYLMPSSFTNWDDDDDDNPAQKWWKNVSREPVWDKDDIFLNYIAHPYVGAIYYMGARSAGVNATGSFLYSFALSTFFWEYGIEAFAERPSIQDLIVTPVAGAAIGELFYLAKRHILEQGGCIGDSEILGKAALIAMDPMTEATELIWGKDKPMHETLALSSQPMLSKSGHLGYRLNFSFAF